MVQHRRRMCSGPRCGYNDVVGYPKDVEEIYLGQNGILANAKKVHIL